MEEKKTTTEFQNKNKVKGRWPWHEGYHTISVHMQILRSLG
jgi:hypothetical protein